MCCDRNSQYGATSMHMPRITTAIVPTNSLRVIGHRLDAFHFCTAWHPMVTQSMLVCNTMAMQCSINHLHCECNAQSIDFCSAVVWMQCSINALATLCSAPSMICWLYTLNAIMLNQCSTLCQRMQCSINMLALHFECRQCPINANPTLWMQHSINALHLECNTQAMLKLGYSLNAMPMLNQWSTPWMQCSTDRDQLPCTRNATLNQWPTLTCDCESMLYCSVFWMHCSCTQCSKICTLLNQC